MAFADMIRGGLRRRPPGRMPLPMPDPRFRGGPPGGGMPPGMIPPVLPPGSFQGPPPGPPGFMPPVLPPGSTQGVPDRKAALMQALQAGMLPGGGGAASARGGPTPLDMMGQANPGATWGGKKWNDPVALFRWIQQQRAGVKSGGQGDFQDFYNKHPGLASAFNMEVAPQAPGPMGGLGSSLMARRRKPLPRPRPIF